MGKNREKSTGVQLDKNVFIIGAIAVLIPTIVLMVAGEAGIAAVSKMLNFITYKIGWFYILIAIGALIFCAWASFSKYGKMVLGDPGEKPEYGFLTWASMIFSSGIGAGILWGGASEWIYYATTPPFGIEPGTEQALNYASTYGTFHWGPTAWALYSVCAVTIGYYYFVKKKPILKISESCRGVMGEKVKGGWGKFIDVLIMVGLVTASATSLGLGTPMVSAGLSKVFGWEDSVGLRLIVLGVVVAIFATSASAGLKKGMARVSNFNMELAFALLLFVFLAGPTLLIIKSGITSTGILFSDYIKMSTYMEPYTTTSTFVPDWTVFYWAWWVCYGPFQGLFFARISKGRTIRSMIVGILTFGTLGCGLFMTIFSNYGIDLLRKGIFDAPARLAEVGNVNTVIMEIWSHLPMAPIFIVGLCLSAVIFMSTTFDAASFTLASLTTKELKANQEPAKWNKLFWALMLGAIPATVILLNGDLKTIQSSSVVGGILMALIVFLVGASFIAETRKDKKYMLYHIKACEDALKAEVDEYVG